MGFILLIKEDFMKNLKFKRIYLLELVITVAISLGIGSILGMKVFSHLYAISGIQARTDMSLSKRMDTLEKQLEQCLEHNHKGMIKPARL